MREKKTTFDKIWQWDIEQLPARDLKVITMVSNPERFKTRYNLYRRFEKHMEDSGVDLITVEIQQGQRPFAVTDNINPNHLQLRTYHQLWHKENALNIAAAHLYKRYPDWQYMAWIDADVMFYNHGWAQEALSMLQKYAIVQLWSSATDLDSAMNPIKTVRSFGWCYHESLKGSDTVSVIVNGKREYNKGIPDWKAYAAQVKPFWHSGYAWAIRRETYEDLGGPYDGGLFEVGILGSGDHHMALAFIGDVERSLPASVTGRYRDMLMEYQTRCEKHLKRNIGFIDGGIAHYWHGSKENRGYRNRWNILSENNYCPLLDLKRDQNGLFMLNDRNIRLRDEIRIYFESRNEDEKY